MEWKRESCGRCAMSTVVDATADESDGDGDADADGSARDPFGGARIEVDEAALRRASPAAWLAGAKRRLDDAATRLIRGR